MKTFILSIMLLITAAGYAQDKAQMNSRIREAYDCLNNRDYSGFGNFVQSDLTEHSPFPGQEPGLDGLIKSFREMFTAFPDLKFEIKDIIISDDLSRAAILIRLTGTNTGNWLGMESTGKKIDVMGIDWLIMREGKASEHYGYIDSDLFMKQLGVSK